MVLEKMKLECPYPIPIQIEDSQKDFINLGANSSLEDIVLGWHLEIRKFFACNLNATGAAKLTDLMKYYIKSLREQAINFEDTETLQIMMDKHIGYIYWLYIDLDIRYPDSYLDYMEHILTFYVNLSFRLMLDLKRKTKITQLMVRNRSQAILKRLSFYLLSSEHHIFHVLIRQSSSLVEDMVRDVIDIHNSNICKQMFRNIYIFFLVKNAVQNKSNEAFCRGFILFENWKAFDDYKQNDQVECCLTKLFNRGSECIKTNPILQKILEPKPLIMTQRMKTVGCDSSITKAYFDHIKSKQKESSEILEDIGKTTQDLGNSSDLEHEDDLDARYKELYDKIIGTPREQKALFSNSQFPQNNNSGNFSIEDGIHIIHSDSDSDSIEQISIIPSQKNHTERIRRNRMNNKAVEDDPTMHSFLDSISLDIDVNERNLSLTKPIEVDKNQNEALSSKDQNQSIGLEFAPEKAETTGIYKPQNRLNIEEVRRLSENTSSIPNVNSSENKTRNVYEEQKHVRGEISLDPHEEVQLITNNVTCVQSLVPPQQIVSIPSEDSRSKLHKTADSMNRDDLEASPFDVPSSQCQNSSVEKIPDISKDPSKIIATIKKLIKLISTDINEKESSQKGSPSVVENTELRNRSESLEFEKMKQPQSSVETKEILSEKVPNEATALPSVDGAVEKTETNAGAVWETVENPILSLASSSKVTYKRSKSPCETTPLPMPASITFNFETDTMKEEVYNNKIDTNENNAELEIAPFPNAPLQPQVLYRSKIPTRKCKPIGRRRGRPPKRAKKSENTQPSVNVDSSIPKSGFYDKVNKIYAVRKIHQEARVKNCDKSTPGGSPSKTTPLPMPVPITFNFEIDTLKKEVYSKKTDSNENYAELETQLPLKKRKLPMPVPVSKAQIATNNHIFDNSESTKEISYPATPMLSIADVYNIMPRLFETPVENDAEFETHLPSKKRKLSMPVSKSQIANIISSSSLPNSLTCAGLMDSVPSSICSFASMSEDNCESTKEIKYPATPMLSIADVCIEPRQFKTPAEKKQLPPSSSNLLREPRISSLLKHVPLQIGLSSLRSPTSCSSSTGTVEQLMSEDGTHSRKKN